MDLSLSNRDFCLFLLLQFPFGADDVQEIMLVDYVIENFDMPAGAWLTELTGATDDAGNEASPWLGYTFAHPVNEAVTFYAEFHPYETVYFFNDVYLGNSGGHFHLSLLSWREFKTIVANEPAVPALLFLLLLPLVIGNETEQEEIGAEIKKYLRQTALQPGEEQLQTLTHMLCRHLIFRDRVSNVLRYQEHTGWVTSRNHSERNESIADDDLRKINEVIKMATLPKQA